MFSILRVSPRLAVAATTALAGAGFAWATSDAASAAADGRAEGRPERPGILAAIGNTPLVELTSLSRATGCRILAKCEHMNPGGSVKDRAALWMVEEAERRGLLVPGQGGTVFEGTGGNTGVGLALVCAAKGYGAVMVMPETIAQEKEDAMRTFGAEVIRAPVVPFTDARHFFHRAREEAKAVPKGFWANQFDNEANARSHIEGTGPEIWRQSGGRVDGFICSSGTGGTIGGVSRFLKAVNPAVQVYVIDPPGSALLGLIRAGGAHNPAPGAVTEARVLGAAVPTRFIPKSAGSHIAEGIGTDRITGNFATALIDGAFGGTNEDMVEMAYHLKEVEGLFVGPSAALNVVGAVKLARKLGPGHTIVTVLCDGGARYASKMYDPAWLAKQGLAPSGRTAEQRRKDRTIAWVKDE